MSAAPDAIDTRLIALRQRGLSWDEIADALGLTTWQTWSRTVRLRKAGVSLPRLWVKGCDWPTAQIATLRRLWDEGHATAEIGRRMGLTKCAIVGKAHRLDLPARPSPIRRGGEPRPARPRRPPRLAPLLPGAATLPPLASVQAAPVPAAPHAPPRTATTSAPAARPAMARSGRVVTCCWPIGEPGKRDGPTAFRFCDAASEPGRPYCADHCRKAYQPRTAERERVA
jgi:GcrA cell cycle regulator